ncbi:hypothetical protein DL93DRAFT_2234551 [Clavulina sp. PMI_390]|nr:hypothetical protein DL93DRAFT_2234551 [Clavulina sp. PMI_390]
MAGVRSCRIQCRFCTTKKFFKSYRGLQSHMTQSRTCFIAQQLAFSRMGKTAQHHQSSSPPPLDEDSSTEDETSESQSSDTDSEEAIEDTNSHFDDPAAYALTPQDSANHNPEDQEDDEMEEDDENPFEQDRLNPDGPWFYSTTAQVWRGKRKGTVWEQMKKVELDGLPFFPWGSMEEFEVVSWLLMEGLSLGAVQRFLRLQYVSERPFSFKSAKDMFRRIGCHMESGPDWHVVDVIPDGCPDQPQPLFYRDPIECAKWLFQNPAFEESMDYEAREIFDKHEIRVWHEESTGDLFNEIQRDRRIPKGAMILSIKLASDKTHLTNFSGDKNMWPVYISIGNIHKGTRNKPSRRAWILLAKLPTPKFAAFKARLDATKAEKERMPGILQKRLFHQCMEIVLAPLKTLKATHAVDPSGYDRVVVPVLTSWLADLEELLLVLGLGAKQCPKCMAGFDELDKHDHVYDTRTADSILQQIRSVREELEEPDIWQWCRSAWGKGLSGVERVCWEGLPVDICRVMCVDALHGLHKMFADHIVKWISNTITENELDLRFIAQPHRIGFRNFAEGVSHLKQRSGRENRDLERLILPALAGAPEAEPSVLKAVRAILDFIAKATMPLHTDETLQLMDADLDEFWRHVDVFRRNGSRLGKKSGKVIQHFKIPKLHLLCHYSSDIRDHGTTDNYSTEICESLHKPYCKAAWHHTNRKEYDQQIIDYLSRMEAIHTYVAYLTWRQQHYPRHENDDYDHDNPHDHPNFPDEDDDDGQPEAPDIAARQLIEQTARYAEEEESRIIPNTCSCVITCPIRPHRIAKPINAMMVEFQIPSLHSAISLYILNSITGAHPHRDEYQRTHLPHQYETLNIWTHVNCERPALNEFYETEYRRLRCGISKGKRLMFDQVLVEVPGRRRGDKPQIRIANLRLIFCSTEAAEREQQPLLAYVQWYKPHTRPHRDHGLRTVEKMLRGNEHAGGVIPIHWIRGPCPLAPRLDGMCPPHLDQFNAFDKLSSFYINPFCSHVDYELFL